MKKLFISQPIANKTNEEILLEREKAINEVKSILKEDVEVIDTFFTDTDMSPLEYLGESLKKLATADIAYFAIGWRKARGCKIECTCASEYGIKWIDGEESLYDNPIRN